GPPWLPPWLAERLAAALSSACFGDPLLGAHLGLGLAGGAGAVTRLQLWNGLTADKALHLLPPLSRCLGSAVQYLGPPPSPSSSSPSLDPAFLAAVQRSLVEGDLERSLLPAPETTQTPSPAPSCSSPSALAAACLARGCSSLAGDVALQLLATWLLRR
ncbi:hypothetical protein Agub_g1921, partial [Astrephomene gubernaculifera]